MIDTDWDLKNLRHERKFYIEEYSPEEIQYFLKLHPKGFSEIYHSRFVNNIYLDTFDKKSYFDNMNGQSRRLKIRIRWYGQLLGKITEPVLEFKIKEGYCSNKISYPLPAMTLDHQLTSDYIQSKLEQSPIEPMLKIQLKGLELSLMNRYERQYFLSTDRKCRATIDKNLEVNRLHSFGNNFLNKSTDRATTILELKYDRLSSDVVERELNYFPFRVTKNSKYVTGIDRLQP